MKMEEAKPQKTEEQKVNEVNGGCLATITGLAVVGIASYMVYIMGEIQGWW